MFGWLGVLLVLTGCEQQTSVIKAKKILTVSPELEDLGAIAVGETATGVLKLSSIQGGDIKIVDLSMLGVAGDWFTADGGTDLVVPDGETVELSVTYTPLEAGYHRSRLTITSDEQSDNKHAVELRGAASFPSADIFPPLLDLGPVATGNSAEESFTIRNSGTVTLQVVGFSFSNPVFTTSQAATSLEPGDELSVPVSYTASDEKAAKGTISLDLGAAPARTVDVMANACKDGDGTLYDTDADGYSICEGDCDDSNAAVRPGLEESCDTIDNNCDGLVDEGTDCADDDGDGLKELDGDCNDGDATVYPGAPEDLTNGIDDDCDGVVDLGSTDGDGDGYTDEDCDDADPYSYPGAPELADGIDNDCDRTVDEGTSVYDDDSDGYTEAAGDCDDTSAAISPIAQERADGTDNDCDGIVDEGTADFDDDGDGFTENGGDCNDNASTIRPGAQEIVGDGLDNDCDGTAY